MITNGFTGECVSAKVIYSEGIFDYNINKIFDIHAEKRYFKNTDHYILSFIEEIKENVIKNFSPPGFEPETHGVSFNSYKPMLYH